MAAVATLLTNRNDVTHLLRSVAEVLSVGWSVVGVLQPGVGDVGLCPEHRPRGSARRSAVPSDGRRGAGRRTPTTCAAASLVAVTNRSNRSKSDPADWPFLHGRGRFGYEQIALQLTGHARPRCAQNRARLVRALYERLDHLEADPASSAV